jgi:phosphoribosyl-ATP pyrophosphohydrolase
MTTVPLIVRAVDGEIESVVACSEKSRSKSIEQDELWIVDPSTGRVLPYRGGGRRYTSLRRRDGAIGEWCETSLTERDRAPAAPGEGDAAPGGDAPAAPGEGDAARVAPGVAASSDAYSFLAELSRLVAQRRRDLPEGSYTTHLFSSGEAKIRKKTGEEAIELVLAENDDELVGEAADLVYHAMVLFEARGIPFRRVVEELQRRHRDG